MDYMSSCAHKAKLFLVYPLGQLAYGLVFSYVQISKTTFQYKGREGITFSNGSALLFYGG